MPGRHGRDRKGPVSLQESTRAISRSGRAEPRRPRQPCRSEDAGTLWPFHAHSGRLGGPVGRGGVPLIQERRLAAILVADVIGYSKLIGRNESGTLASLSALRRELIEPAIARHSGRL